MMHLCRSLFPTSLETPGLLFEIISKSFALYRDIKKENKEGNIKRLKLS